MKARPVSECVEWVGAIDWDRRMFDGFMPLPDGTSYNAYLVRGSDKTALIDTVDPAFAHTLLARLEAAGVERLDFVICQHAEQDHSGSIPAVLARYPEATVLVTEKGKPMLTELLGVDAARVTIVEDGEVLQLGGASLEFLHYPWVHWPETMLTLLPERQVLFTTDLFGSHLAKADLFFDNQAEVLLAAKRYFAAIMMPFRGLIAKRLAKITDRDVAIIAPSHGPLHRDPAVILDAYREWIAPATKNLAVVAYTSMHDTTKRLVEHFVDGCADRGVWAEQVQLADTDPGKLAMLLVDATTLVLATPTVIHGAHPHVLQAAQLANLIRPKAKYLGIICSYGWNTEVVEQLGGLVPNLQVETLPPVLCCNLPDASDWQALDQLADAIADKHRAL